MGFSSSAASFLPSHPDVPTSLHDLLVQIFVETPELAIDLAGARLGIGEATAYEVRPLSGELGQLLAPQHRADAVLLLQRDGSPALAVVLEVQLSRDDEKRYSWPVYLTGVRARLRCPTLLAVVSPYPEVAKWAAGPIALGPGVGRIQPLVIGPERIPPVTDLEQAKANVRLAFLSAVARPVGRRGRGGGLGGDPCGAGARRGSRQAYTHLILENLGERERETMEAKMEPIPEYKNAFARKYVAQGRAEGRAEGKAEGEAEGKAEGEAKALLAFLAARQLSLSGEARERILACRDLATLDRWIARAAAVRTLAELFEEQG